MMKVRILIIVCLMLISCSEYDHYEYDAACDFYNKNAQYFDMAVENFNCFDMPITINRQIMNGNDTVDYAIIIDTLTKKTLSHSEYESMFNRFRIKGKFADSTSKILKGIKSSGINMNSERISDLVSMVRLTNKLNLMSLHISKTLKDDSSDKVEGEFKLNSSEFILFSESINRSDVLTDKSDVLKKISGNYYYYKMGRTRGFFFSD